jgi:cytochrome c5
MRGNTSLALAVAVLVVTTGVLAACGGPAVSQPSPEEEGATTAPVTEEQPTVTLTAPGEAEPTEPPSSDEGMALLEERCTACHSLDRVTSAGRTREQRAQTLDRMTGYGAELNAEEREALLDYLAQTYGP